MVTIAKLLLSVLFGIALDSSAAFAQVKLPNASERKANISLDPFESSRKFQQNQTPSSSTSDTENSTLPKKNKPTETENPDKNQSSTKNINLSPPAENEKVNPSTTEQTPAPIESTEPPYSYTLFLDLDYVNKFSGGASSDPMGDDPDKAPSSTAMVGLLHFWGTYDTAKAGLWKNGTFVLHWIYGDGTSPTGTVGDLRSVSNIDASFMSSGKMVMPGFDLLEFWYEHDFPFNRSSIRFGVGYLSTDFYKSKYTGLFLTSGINSIGTEILWNTMASNPPNTTLGLWYKTKLSDNVYAQAVAFDGFPDHSTKFFDLELDADEGIFLATEVGWQQGPPKQTGYLKVGFGHWYLSQNIKQNMMVGIEDYEGDPIATRGVYTVVDKAIDNDIGLFFKGGLAINGINKYRHYFSSGISYKGLIPSRPKDTAGIAIVQSKLSDTYLDYHGTDDKGNVTSFSEETIYEVTYSIPVNNWLMIQPDIQYVMQPGMNIMNKNALVGIIRAEITLL